MTPAATMTSSSEALLNSERLNPVSTADFAAAQPFPNLPLSACLTPAAFTQLLADFPAPELFVRQQGIHPDNILRPHDRYYLALSDQGGVPQTPGITRTAELAPSWRKLIEELRSPPYQQFIKRLFGCRQLRTRFAWHLGHQASEVSPHLDAARKIGTHLLYFNTSDDWQPDWGGSTLLLGQPRNGSSQPDFDDFATCQSAPWLDNHSLLFRNGPAAWHGVERMNPLPGHYRRLFTVVFDHPHPVHLARLGTARLRALMGRP